ncbi:FYDLN acid domain-containing protein [Myxococcota bacterium]|nr:FYDLN acid domain-containing protein [Myxococcota bacterium]
MVPTGPRHPKLGFRWSCYGCGAKFYDLGKDEPLCPKCGADQRDRPADEPRSQSSDPARPRVVRPMAQLLDDDEPVAPLVEDDLGLDDVVESGDMFEGDGDITHLELDAADLEGDTIEAAETDEF